MKVLILMGSPRANGNTAELCMPFKTELEKHGAEVRYTELANKHIAPCLGCYACQDIADRYGCIQHDDMYSIAEEVMWADCIVLATPIYSWYCTAQMKAFLDRHYGFNKYYGSAEGCLWAGKSVALILTHGYKDNYATEPFVVGMQRFCKHSNLKYLGMYSVRDEDNLASFRTKEAVDGARAFAKELLK